MYRFGNPTENYKFGLLIFMPQLRFIPPFTDIVNDLEKDVKFVMGNACLVLRTLLFIVTI